MRSVKATAWRQGKLGRGMLPVYLLCAAIIVTLVLANLSKAVAEPGSLQTDDRGFINTAARCDAPKSAVAVGRTEQSLIAICVDRSGHYEYRGVRLKDNSGLNVTGALMKGGRYIAHNADFTYLLGEGTDDSPGLGMDGSQGADGGIRGAAPAGRRL